MNTIAQYVNQSLEYDAHKADYSEFARNLHFDETSALVIPPQMFGAVMPMKPTTWAWGQIFSKLGPAVYGKGCNKTLPSDYLLAIPADLRAQNLNRHLQNANGAGWMVRGYDDQARAVLSEGYATIANTELLEILDGVITQNQTADFHLSRPSVTPDDLNIRTIWKDTKGGNYGIGVYIGNAEIGNRRLRIYPLIQRHSCENSIIIEHDKGIEFVHRGSKITKMILVKSVIAELFGVAAEVLEKMIAAESQQIPDFADVLDGLAIKYGWNDGTKTSVTLGTEGQQTRAGIVNGVTYAAHAIDTLTPNESADMEILGGRILLAPDSLFRSAVYAAKANQ